MKKPAAALQLAIITLLLAERDSPPTLEQLRSRLQEPQGTFDEAVGALEQHGLITFTGVRVGASRALVYFDRLGRS